MDNPKLTLVQASNSLSGNVSGNSVEGEHEWLIDACDLEGVEAEEIEEDGLAKNALDLLKERDLDEGQIATNTNGYDDEDRPFTFEFTTCSECNTADCSRPVKEICGHVKCRNCFVNSEDGCRQCIQQTQVVGMDHTDHTSEIESEEVAAEDVKKLVIKPNEYILELGESLGNRSLAVVSAETLKELGIQHLAHDDSAEEVEADSSEEDQDLENGDTTEMQDAASNDTEESFHDTVEFFEDTAETSMDSNDFNVTKEIKHEDAPHVNPTTKKKKTMRKKRSKVLAMDHIIFVKEDKPGTKTYKCLKCDKCFTQEYQRKYHTYCHPENGNRPYICHCSAEFISQSHYMYHVRSQHTGEKPYECPVCSQRFIQKVKLNRHMTMHTSKPAKPADLSTYLCAYCKKRFNSLASCKRHIKNHTEERAFTCKTCDKSFKQKYALELHIKTHLNKRPFKCPDCEKAFSTAKDMRRHHLGHTGELPFPCAFGDCNSKFRRKDNLERHIRKTHKLPDKVAKVLGNEAAKNYSKGKKLGGTSDGTVIANNEQVGVNEIVDIITST